MWRTMGAVLFERVGIGMKRVIVTCGPRGAGKSTFCDAVAEAYPHIRIVSRDAISLERFGTVCLDPRSGLQERVMKLSYAAVQNILSDTFSDSFIIFDCWNGFPQQRRQIVRKLRRLGAESVWAWYFITPVEVCSDWFCKRESLEYGALSAEVLAQRCVVGYDLFHGQAYDLKEQCDTLLDNKYEAGLPRSCSDDDAFDYVQCINPAQNLSLLSEVLLPMNHSGISGFHDYANIH